MHVYKFIYMYTYPLGPKMDLGIQKGRAFKAKVEESYDEAENNETGEALDIILNMKVWENRRQEKQAIDQKRQKRIVRRKKENLKPHFSPLHFLLTRKFQCRDFY